MKKENEEIIGEILIDEKSYQQIKKNMGKVNDYFSIDEWEKLGEKLT